MFLNATAPKMASSRGFRYVKLKVLLSVFTGFFSHASHVLISNSVFIEIDQTFCVVSLFCQLLLEDDV